MKPSQAKRLGPSGPGINPSWAWCGKSRRWSQQKGKLLIRGFVWFDQSILKIYVWRYTRVNTISFYKVPRCKFLLLFCRCRIKFPLKRPKYRNQVGRVVVQFWLLWSWCCFNVYFDMFWKASFAKPFSQRRNDFSHDFHQDDLGTATTSCFCTFYQHLFPKQKCRQTWHFNRSLLEVKSLPTCLMAISMRRSCGWFIW